MKFKSFITKPRAIILSIVILILFIFIGCLGFIVYQKGGINNFFSNWSSYEMYDEVELGVGETAVFKDGQQTIRFRFLQIDGPSHPEMVCIELCMDWVPTIRTELVYLNKTYKGVLYGSDGTIDMSFEENGDYKSIPFYVEVTSTDFNQHSAKIRIVKK